MIPSSGQNTLSRFESFSSRLPLRSSVGSGSSRVDLLGLLVLAQPLVRRRPETAVVRPLDELDLAHEPRLDPDDVALAHLRHLRHGIERRRRPARAGAAARAAARSPASVKPVPPLPTQRSFSPPSRDGEHERAEAPGVDPGPSCSRRSRTPGCRASSSSASRGVAARRYGESARLAITPSSPCSSLPRPAPRRPRRPRRAARAFPRCRAAPPAAGAARSAARSTSGSPSTSSTSNTT